MEITELVEVIKQKFPNTFNGKEAITILKQNNFNWRQMQWAGFYTQYLMGMLMTGQCPDKAWGNTYGHTTFDAQLNGIDVDFKTHSINKPNGKPSPPWVICNDWDATKQSIRKNGLMYLIVPNIEFIYDNDGSFKMWHDTLKGEQSAYCKKQKRSSRKRKVHGSVKNVSIYRLTEEMLQNNSLCKEMKQGRNSNGKPRPTKMAFNIHNAVAQFVIEKELS